MEIGISEAFLRGQASPSEDKISCDTAPTEASVEEAGRNIFSSILCLYGSRAVGHCHGRNRADVFSLAR